MAPKNYYYRVLQVDPQAEAEVIQSAYRRLAAKYHPDVNKSPTTEAKMKEINAAYEVLGDPQKRAEYDRIQGIHKETAGRTAEEQGHGPRPHRETPPRQPPPSPRQSRTASRWPKWAIPVAIILALIIGSVCHWQCVGIWNSE